MTHDEHPQDEPETGAEGSGSEDLALPFEPRPDDDSPVGDTDQHSKVDHNVDPADGIKPGNAAND